MVAADDIFDGGSIYPHRDSHPARREKL